MHGLTRLAWALLVLTFADPSRAQAPAPPSDPSSRAPTPSEDPSQLPVVAPVAACAHQHEVAQVERMEGRLLEARQALLSCASEECPSVVRTDCIAWLDEVKALIPTVVFEAVGDDGLLTDVKVELRGQVLQTSLDGKLVEMPVGLADLTFTRHSGEKKSLRVLLRQGETNRIVSADFRTPRDAEAPSVAPAPAPAPPDLVEVRPVPSTVWLLGAGTIAMVVAGATFGTIAKAKESDAASSCAPHCASGVVSEIKDFALAADISFGVAIATGVTTAVLYFARPSVLVPRESARLTPRLLASPSGAWLGIRGRFQ